MALAVMIVLADGGAAQAATGKPINTVLPSIAGTPLVAQTLTAVPGSWTGTAPINYSYQWRRCDASGAKCTDIKRATGPTYVLATADIGKTIRVLVTATNSGGSTSATSVQTATVAATAPPANSSPPSVSGTAQEGQVLRADPGTWSGTQPISYAYQWQRCDQITGACANVFGATGNTYTLTSADVGAKLRVAVTATNGAGSGSATSAQTPVVVAVSDPVIAAAGDIACDSHDSAFNGGAGTATACQQKATSQLLADMKPSAVLPLGDNQYDCSALNQLSAVYDPTWGRFKSITYPAAGNHEYKTSDAFGKSDCSKSPQDYFSYFGPAAGDPTKGYYSYDIGTWHIIVLNTNEGCTVVHCGAATPQEQWLKQDLAAHPATCTLAYWHAPRFSSVASRASTDTDAWWKDLYASGAEIVLNGHAHVYERFAPQTPAAVADPSRGIREFVVGTGGGSHDSFDATRAANSEIRNNTTFGVLQLTLHRTSYDWKFVPAAGQTFNDSGSTSCH